MDKLKFILDLIKTIKNPVARLVFITLFVIASGIVLYFTSGCAYKMHVDHVDNLTRNVEFKGIEF